MLHRFGPVVGQCRRAEGDESESEKQTGTANHTFTLEIKSKSVVSDVIGRAPMLFIRAAGCNLWPGSGGSRIMIMAGLAALAVAQAGGMEAPLRTRDALNCVAVPVLMSSQGDSSLRRAVARRIDRRLPRPTPRCFRLSAR
jgi:hypothetical protein